MIAASKELNEGKFEGFRDQFCRHASEHLKPQDLVPELLMDCVAELTQLTEPLVNDLRRLGPFGHGNPRPLLCCRGLELVAAPRRVGNSGDHLQLLVRQGSAMPYPMKCIAFGYGPLFDRLTPGTVIDLAVEASINEYNGRRSVELEVKDVRFPAS